MEDTFTCDSCGHEFPRSRMKEAFATEGRERVRRELCPGCLDRAMNASSTVRGIVGQEKAAGVHLDGGIGSERRSLGQRERETR